MKTTTYTAMAYGMPTTISNSATKDGAIAGARRKARKAMRDMKTGAQVPAIVFLATICGKLIKHDNSGVGHNWRTINANDIPADIAEEIAAEIIDGWKSCNEFIGSNGLHYAW